MLDMLCCQLSARVRGAGTPFPAHNCCNAAPFSAVLFLLAGEERAPGFGGAAGAVDAEGDVEDPHHVILSGPH